jgi:pimeloyl-ACP methyl ester carboxylesterase
MRSTVRSPEQLASFIGRDRELASLMNLLVKGSAVARLITLTGPPGTGKTRLALRLVDELDALGTEAWFVPLAFIRDPTLVGQAVAQVLGVREGSRKPIGERVIAFLESRSGLLVLDNFEHILAGAPLVAQLLEHCPQLKVLVAPVPAAEIPFPDAEKERWLAVARSGDRDLFEEWLRAWTKDPLDSDIVDRYFYDVTRTSQITLGATLDMAIHGAFMDRLQSITAPTLVIGGRYDPILTPATLRDAVVTPIARARFAVLECGHEVPVEQPQILGALLEAFLAGLSA